jgi:hypothetical protein
MIKDRYKEGTNIKNGKYKDKGKYKQRIEDSIKENRVIYH